MTGGLMQWYGPYGRSDLFNVQMSSFDPNQTKCLHTIAINYCLIVEIINVSILIGVTTHNYLNS